MASGAAISSSPTIFNRVDHHLCHVFQPLIKVIFIVLLAALRPPLSVGSGVESPHVISVGDSNILEAF